MPGPNDLDPQQVQQTTDDSQNIQLEVVFGVPPVTSIQNLTTTSSTPIATSPQ